MQVRNWKNVKRGMSGKRWRWVKGCRREKERSGERHTKQVYTPQMHTLDGLHTWKEIQKLLTKSLSEDNRVINTLKKL